MQNNDKKVLLRISNLKQYFPLKGGRFVKANDGITLDIYEGETFGLVGESGSGKTTIGRAILRILPTTPCAIGQGVILCAPNAHVAAEDTAEFRTLMAGAGLIDELPEKLIDAAGTLTGCGPAFAYLFAEALADGGVACGLPRAKAQTYAAAMLRGSAAMVLETGKHPGELKDAVCSPGGTTIEGVAALERNGFRSAAIEAVRASFGKTAKLG